MDDKKKILIIGALLVVMLGVGAFQFMQSGSPAPAPEAKKTESNGDAIETTEEAEGTAKPVALDEDGQPVEGVKPEEKVADGTEGSAEIAVVAFRDPFDGRKWNGEVAAKNPAVNGVPQRNPEPAPQTAIRRPMNRQIEIPPFNAGGSLGIQREGLPATGPNAGTMPMGGPGMPSIEDVPYQVAGTIRGKRQAALFKDGSGSQRLVRVGDKLDGDTEVIGVTRGKVIVKHRGKVKTLEVDREAPKSGEKPKTGVENLPSGGQ